MDASLLINPPSESVVHDLTCPICQCIVLDACYTSCEHVFCSSCLAAWRASNATCPSCREMIEEPGRPPRMMRNALEELLFTCPNGCEVAVQYSTFQDHLESRCVARTELCPVRGCGVSVVVEMMEQHMTSETARHMTLMVQELQRTTAELDQTRAHLVNTTEELSVTREQLTRVQGEVQELHIAQEQLRITQEQLKRVQEEVERPDPRSEASSSSVTQFLKRAYMRWRRDHPFGFYARLAAKPDGSRDLLTWECGVPGVAGTIWEGGLFRLTLTFPEESALEVPRCVFVPPLFHPNVYPSGVLCLTISRDYRHVYGGSPKALLLRIQEMLDNPLPAQTAAYALFERDIDAYHRRVRQQVEANPAPYVMSPSTAPPAAPAFSFGAALAAAAAPAPAWAPAPAFSFGARPAAAPAPAPASAPAPAFSFGARPAAAAAPAPAPAFSFGARPAAAAAPAPASPPAPPL